MFSRLFVCINFMFCAHLNIVKFLLVKSQGFIGCNLFKIGKIGVQLSTDGKLFVTNKLISKRLKFSDQDFQLYVDE